jgi:hypothetical protein
MARRNSALLGTLILASTVFLFLWPAMVHAQDVSLSGTVTDATDAVLPAWLPMGTLSAIASSSMGSGMPHTTCR